MCMISVRDCPVIPLDRINNIRRMKGDAFHAYLAKYGDRAVYIYSHEHKAFWGPNRGGYFTNVLQAGVYTLSDAFEVTWHCGPEKRIYYAFVRPTNAA